MDVRFLTQCSFLFNILSKCNNYIYFQNKPNYPKKALKNTPPFIHLLMKKILLVFTCLIGAKNSDAQSWNLALNAISGNPNFGTSSNHPINFFTNGTQRMTLSTTGSLRINTLAGTGNRFIQADANGNLVVWTGSVGNKDYLLYGDGVWKLPPVMGEAGNLFTAANSKLGIGIAIPAVALDVSGDVAATGAVKATDGFKFNTTDGITYNATENVFAVGKLGYLPPPVDPCSSLPVPNSTTWFQANQGGFISSQVNPSTATSVNAALRMYISPSNGSGYIEVNGKDNLNAANNSLNINYSCGRNTNINTGSFGGNVNICSGTTGNVGIGAFSTINNRLTISGNNTGLNVSTTHASDNMYNTQLKVDRNYAKALTIINTAINPAGDENFIVFGDGRTRIGGDYVTANENYYKLSVNGAIIAEEVVIMLRASWPDYVFSKHYQLMPISEVEKFIHKNHHLPNIPSAQEIKEKGLSTAEILSKQMEKIEELTLYLIDIKKQVDLLQEENEMLKTKNK